MIHNLRVSKPAGLETKQVVKVDLTVNDISIMPKNNNFALKTKAMQAYFNLAYNPVYDVAVGQLNLYRELQEMCVEKLELEDNDRILCIGLGTGNEVAHILEMNRNISIVGMDYSQSALRKARKKALALNNEIEVLVMDVRHLAFETGSFDKVICIHVMDFVHEREAVTGEILRVLKDGGRFVITYPSQKENANMGLNIINNNIHHYVGSGSSCLTAFVRSLAQMVAGTVYLPFLLRSKRFISRHELQTILGGLTTGNNQIEEFPSYNDFIAYGIK